LIQDAFLLDHLIDNRLLYPGTGFIVLAWQTLCILNSVELEKTTVVFEEVTLESDLTLSESGTFRHMRSVCGVSSCLARYDVVITPSDGRFEILNGDHLVSSGRIQVVQEVPPSSSSDHQPPSTDSAATIIGMNCDEIYKTLRVRGYDYGSAFR
jgi:fatty acid synthase